MVERVGNTVLNLAGMKKFARDVDKALRSTTSGPMMDVRKQWAVRYRSEMQARFNKFARGGGNWEGLKASTIAARRHGKGGKSQRGKGAHAKAKATGGGQVSILIDNGQLIGALSPVFARRPGQYEKGVPFGIIVGFGGGASKKDHKGKKTSKTIAEIANIHQEGKGNNPQRKILVKPSSETRMKMVGDTERGLRKMIKNSQVRTAV